MPRKVTCETVAAFLNKRTIRRGATVVALGMPQALLTRTGYMENGGDAYTLSLHGNAIACRYGGVLYVHDGGVPSNTTKERLNALPGVGMYHRAFVAHLETPTRGGAPWDGAWLAVGELAALGRPWWITPND